MTLPCPLQRDTDAKNRPRILFVDPIVDVDRRPRPPTSLDRRFVVDTDETCLLLFEVPLFSERIVAVISVDKELNCLQIVSKFTTSDVEYSSYIKRFGKICLSIVN